MKNKIWAFGGSFTETFKPPVNGHRHWRTAYIDWKGYVPKNYVEIISEELNLPLINKASGGKDNNFIFEEFCKVCENINPDDIVIFGWTTLERLRLIKKNGKWSYFNPGIVFNDEWFAKESMEDFDFVSKDTIRELMLNKKNTLNLLELMNWIKLINLSLKNMKVIHWTWDPRLEIQNVYRALGYKTITDEMNSKFHDNHWCEESHREFADLLIKNLLQETIPLNENKRFI